MLNADHVVPESTQHFNDFSRSHGQHDLMIELAGDR